jgi:hypothetical protein
LFYNIGQKHFKGQWRLAISAVVFSVGYAFLEYYVIRDTTFGLQPVLFSLLYPYHFLMALAFGLAGYAFLRTHSGPRALLPGIILTGALFSTMLVIEDFMWFTLRAAAPLQEDMNGGRLVMQGEWSTQFLGSVDAHLTAIPNWYFLNLLFTLAVIMTTRSRQKIAETITGTP